VFKIPGSDDDGTGEFMRASMRPKPWILGVLALFWIENGFDPKEHLQMQFEHLNY